MILCVCPSPAWDVTYHVDRLREHTTNRAVSVAGRAGGKAVNVARVLHTLGEPVTVLAPVGGPTGQLFVDDLGIAGIALEAVAQDTETRRTISVVSLLTADATAVNEPATLPDWSGFLAHVERLVPQSEVVVASGSLPAGAPVDAYAQLCRVAAVAGVPVVVDTSGPALAEALAAGPTLVKPNLDELRDVAPDGDPLDAARTLADASGSAVAVSLGADGLLVVCDDGAWTAAGGGALRGNPTGAGDAAVAAFARGLRSGAAWSVMVADAVALSGAAVLSAQAGDVSLAHYAEVSAAVTVGRPGGPQVPR